jgi:thiamine pyrophosphokinase
MQWGVPISKDEDQYSTDLRKCLGKIDEFAGDQRLHPLDVVILGGLGGRVDQGFSLIHQLYKTAIETPEGGRKLILISSENISFVMPAGQNIIHTPLQYLAENIGIIPLDGAAVISTKGLEWDVTDWKTDFGGQVSTSNHIRASKIEVVTDRPVLFTVEISRIL